MIFVFGVRDDWGFWLEYKWFLPLMARLAGLFLFWRAFGVANLWLNIFFAFSLAFLASWRFRFFGIQKDG
jgi:hypothetical protein